MIFICGVGKIHFPLLFYFLINFLHGWLVDDRVWTLGNISILMFREVKWFASRISNSTGIQRQGDWRTSECRDCSFITLRGEGVLKRVCLITIDHLEFILGCRSDEGCWRKMFRRDISGSTTRCWTGRLDRIPWVTILSCMRCLDILRERMLMDCLESWWMTCGWLTSTWIGCIWVQPRVNHIVTHVNL